MKLKEMVCFGIYFIYSFLCTYVPTTTISSVYAQEHKVIIIYLNDDAFGEKRFTRKRECDTMNKSVYQKGRTFQVSIMHKCSSEK